MRALTPALIACLWCAGACNDTSGIPPGVSLRIITGGDQTDTARAILRQPLVIEVRDSASAPARGVSVVLQALLADSTPCNGLDCPVLLRRSLAVSSSLTLAAGSDGRVSVSVQVGQRAGDAGVRISVPQFFLVTIAPFHITPAAPAAVVARPPDTALYVGATFAPRGMVTDQYGNPRPEPVTYTGAGPAATVDSGHTITGRVIGRASYLVQGLGFTDTGWVSVVPPGEFASIGPGGVTVMNLDGSNSRVLAPSNSYANGYPSWANPPTTLAFDYGGTDKLATVDMAGTVQLVLSAGDSGLSLQTWPTYSRDGTWIYFQGDQLVWRVHGDGSALARVSPPAPFGTVDRWPSPSPDGTQLVFASNRTNASNGLDIELLDLATDSLTSLGVNGVSPRWSPTADSIAYVDIDGRVKVLATNGSGLRALTPSGHAFAIALDWSPDGQWLLARDDYALALIHVFSGMILPLGYATNLNNPVWRP